MRKLLFIIMFVLVAGVASQAGNVTKEDAARKAAAFLNLKSESQLQLLDCGYETMYLFAIQNGGFVVVSADNRVQPILAYSRVSGIDPQRLPKNLKGWLDGYDKQIRISMEAEGPVAEGWGEESARKSAEGFDSIVGPLLTTSWGQNTPYNDLCPYDDDAEDRSLTGCVATAMAQVMKYWNWPDTGVGQYSYSSYYYGQQSANFGETAYDWANMPATLMLPCSDAEVGAVSTLMYHCAVAVKTDFNPEIYGGSGAMSRQENASLDFPCAENALRTYFKYAPSLYGINRSLFSNSEWTNLIKQELDCRRPVLYEGQDASLGHEFVCDGYDTNGFFHFNWGFDGIGDGYYTFSLLTPPGYNFSSQGAIVGLEPDTLFGTGATCTVRGLSSDTTMGTVVGCGVYNYRDTVYLQAVPAPMHRFLRWNNGSTLNPYPLLAHDVEMTATFSNALIDDGTTMTYSPSDMSGSGAFIITPEARVGIKIPASALRGHNYVTAVEFYNYNNRFMASIHRGGEDAPGEVVYSQPFEIPHGPTQWYRAKMEVPVPIDTTQNLWITLRCFEFKSFTGVPGLAISEANWYSPDEGETWMHLTEAPYDPSFQNNTITWPIRCITSQTYVVDSTVVPTAFILGPEECSAGDTITAELIHATGDSVQWVFGNAAWAESNGDTARIVWDQEGWQMLSAIVTTPIGVSSNANLMVLVYDCSDIDDFPYILEFTEEYESRTACWDFRSLGEEKGYRYGSTMRMMLIPGVDYWLISPEIDLSENENVFIEWNYNYGSPADITLQVSQGGNDTADFTPVFTLEYNEAEHSGISTPVKLNDFYQGNPIRIAFRITGVEEDSFEDFQIERIVMWNEPLGIEGRTAEQMAVYPNPSHGKVTVSLPEAEGTLTLFDATGRRLMQRSTHAQKTTLDVTNLPTGIYMVQFTSKRGTTVSRLAVR